MHAATGTTIPLLLLLLPCDFRGQPSVVESSSPFVGASFSNFLNIIPLHCTVVFRVSRLCVRCLPCVRRGVFSKFFYCRQPSLLCAGEAFFAASATTKARTTIMTNVIQGLAESLRKYAKAIQSIVTVTVPDYSHASFVPKNEGAVLKGSSAVPAVRTRLYVQQQHADIS